MWMATTDDRGMVKYWQSNMNNVHSFQAHSETIRGCRWDARPNATSSGTLSSRCCCLHVTTTIFLILFVCFVSCTCVSVDSLLSTSSTYNVHIIQIRGRGKCCVELYHENVYHWGNAT